MAIMTFEDKAARRAKECANPRNHMENEMWNMSFDRSVNKEGAGVGVWINPSKVG
jgi:hypothetical protein